RLGRVRRPLAVCLSFFFQAEDGIRDDLVTGVQTCALPICPSRGAPRTCTRPPLARGAPRDGLRISAAAALGFETSTTDDGPLERSEERRVGKGGSYRWGRGPEVEGGGDTQPLGG